MKNKDEFSFRNKIENCKVTKVKQIAQRNVTYKFALEAQDLKNCKFEIGLSHGHGHG